MTQENNKVPLQLKEMIIKESGLPKSEPYHEHMKIITTRKIEANQFYFKTAYDSLLALTHKEDTQQEKKNTKIDLINNLLCSHSGKC